MNERDKRQTKYIASIPPRWSTSCFIPVSEYVIVQKVKPSLKPAIRKSTVLRRNAAML